MDPRQPEPPDVTVAGVQRGGRARGRGPGAAREPASPEASQTNDTQRGSGGGDSVSVNSSVKGCSPSRHPFFELIGVALREALAQMY